MELISHFDAHFNFLKAMSQAFPKLAYPTHLLYGKYISLCGKSKKKCVYAHTHTHTLKNQNQALHGNNRELSLALSFSFY